MIIENFSRTNGAKDIIIHVVDLIKTSYMKGVHIHAHSARMEIFKLQ